MRYSPKFYTQRSFLMEFRGSYVMLGTRRGLAACISSTLTTVHSSNLYKDFFEREQTHGRSSIKEDCAL